RNPPPEWTARSVRSLAHLERDGIAETNLVARLWHLLDDDARRQPGVGHHRADRDAERPALAQDLDRPRSQRPDQVRHHIALAALAPVDEQRHGAGALL